MPPFSTEENGVKYLFQSLVSAVFLEQNFKEKVSYQWNSIYMVDAESLLHV